MLTPKRPRLIRPKALRPFRGRSAAYSWLRQHYDDVRRLRTTWPWAVLIEEMRADGVVGRGGTGLTEKAVSMVWQRVCRDVDTEQATTGATAVKRPSRSAPPGSRPVLVPATVVASPTAAPRSQTPAPACPGRPSPVPPGAGDEEARRRRAAEETERALARLAARDERLRF